MRRYPKALLTAAIGMTFGCAMGATANEPLVVYDIRFQAPLSVPECSISSYYRKSKGASESLKYDLPKDGPCYKRSGVRAEAAPMHDETVVIAWPFMKGPKLAQGDSMSARMVSGKVERLSFATYGLSSQANDMAALTQKFGPNAVVRNEQVRNALGGTFDAITATWHLEGGVTVSFRGIEGRIDSGSVVIASPAGEASLKTALDRVFNSGRPAL